MSPFSVSYDDILIFQLYFKNWIFVLKIEVFNRCILNVISRFHITIERQFWLLALCLRWLRASQWRKRWNWFLSIRSIWQPQNTWSPRTLESAIPSSRITTDLDVSNIATLDLISSCKVGCNLKNGNGLRQSGFHFLIYFCILHYSFHAVY